MKKKEQKKNFFRKTEKGVSTNMQYICQWFMLRK